MPLFYLDIAIGAPFGGEDGKGVVFIYNGGPKGLKNDFKPSQVFLPYFSAQFFSNDRLS